MEVINIYQLWQGRLYCIIVIYKGYVVIYIEIGFYSKMGKNELIIFKLNQGEMLRFIVFYFSSILLVIVYLK